MKILLVEDDAQYRDMLRTVLEIDGHTVIIASGGELAFKMVQESRPDIIISDINMPNGSGTELRDLVRGDKRVREIPFIFVTGDPIQQVTASIDHSQLDFKTSKIPCKKLFQIVRELSSIRGKPNSHP